MDQMRDWMVAKYTNAKCASPMEALFLAGWGMATGEHVLPPEARLQIAQQAPVGKYKADFLFSLKATDGSAKELVVEIDGHDFHERTKAQAAHDKARDRWMTGTNYQVMRFTGSEVYANPFKCATEVAERLYLLRHGTTRKEAIALAGFESIRAMLRG
jgi:very-short-patch-repair endonuclease